ncbi:PaaI family thioesterase [Paenibacillus sp. OAS669]|uniref:PaaI family thioesterase n=1 Tax=Paenibacillus sp. OAS669 TaxID=2663821 RepID=UPI001CEF098F|nr:PaaI family thioesterase [Paenibacillus sp. OAS669]
MTHPWNNTRIRKAHATAASYRHSCRMAMGIAYGSSLQQGETFTTIEMKVNFFRPVWNAKIIAYAMLYKSGQTIGFVQCNITDENGKLVAHASSTCMTLRGDKAQGR